MQRWFGRIAFVVVLLVVLVAATGCLGGGGGSSVGDSGGGDDSPHADPEAVIREYNERSKEKDVEGIADLFTYPAKMSLADAFEWTFDDRDELIDYFKTKVLPVIGEVYDSQVSIIDTVVNDDTATVEFEVTQDVENLALGRRVQSRARDVAQLKRILGRWYISHLHTAEILE